MGASENATDAGDATASVVNAQVALAIVPPGLPALTAAFSGLGAVVSNQESEHMLRTLHVKIRQIYKNTIVSDVD